MSTAAPGDLAAGQSSGDLKKRFAVAIVVTAGVCAAGAMVAIGDPSNTAFIIAAGALSSLIASLVFSGMSMLVLGETATRTERAARRLEAGLVSLTSAIPILEQADSHAITSVQPKIDYTAAQWKSVLENTHGRLFLVGHALDKWCRDGIEPVFAETIDRLARSGKPVRLLTRPLGEVDMKRELGHDKRLRTTLRLVANVYVKLPESARRNLQVKALKKDVAMHYMLVANESVVITSPYPTTAQVSTPMLAVTVASESTFGAAIWDDAIGLFESYSETVALEPFAP